MEKQEIKEIDQVYTRFRGGEISMDSYAVQVVLHHLPEGLLRCSVSAVDQELCWNCEHTGRVSLAKYCSQNELGREELRWIYGGLLKNLKEVREYLLDANCLILKPEQIYVTPEDAKIRNCYVPFYIKNVWRGLEDISQYLLGYLNKGDAEAVRIAYEMYRYFNQGGRSIEEAWAILCESTEEKEKDKEEVTEKENPNEENPAIDDKTFPVVGWIIMGLSGAAAVFVIVYVALNEWYLSDVGKIFFLALAVVFGAISILSWKRWGSKMKKASTFLK